MRATFPPDELDALFMTTRVSFSNVMSPGACLAEHMGQGLFSLHVSGYSDLKSMRKVLELPLAQSARIMSSDWFHSVVRLQ